MAQKRGFQMIAEMKEFGAFTAAEQRYIGRSLEVASAGISAADRWCRNSAEAESITAQSRLYRTVVPALRLNIPEDPAFDAASEFVGSLMRIAAFDLGEGRIESFAAFRFLYERLLGGAARPWLLTAFAGAAALPALHPSHRRVLLVSITAADAVAPGWSLRNPAFVPEWVEKVPVTVS
jgi:hypothetical protein